MTDHSMPVRPAMHECPMCHLPQTRIQRKLDGEKHGATNYVCARPSQCALGIDLSKVETWIAV